MVSDYHPIGSVDYVLHNFDDPRPRIPYLDATPQPLQRGPKGLRLLQAVELEVDHHIVWIIHRPHDLVAPHSRTLAAQRIAVKRLLSTGVTGNAVLDAQYGHLHSHF